MSWIELVAQRLPGMQFRAKASAPGKQPEAKAPSWYSIENAAEETADVFVYDAIDSWGGVGAENFVKDLGNVTARNINLRINSPGGSVFEGITIANALRAHPAKVTTYVDGLAASIASVIALAGDRVVMMPQSQLMIHDASGVCFGNTSDMQDMAMLLDKQSDNIAQAYAAKAGGSSAQWRDVMKAETWFLADEAVAAGLADEAQSLPDDDDGAEQEEAEAEEEEGEEGDGTSDRYQSPFALLSNRWDLSVFRYAGREQAPAPAVTNRAEPEPEAPAVEPQTAAVTVTVDADEVAQRVLQLLIDQKVISPPGEDAAPEAVAETENPEPEPEPPVEPVDEWSSAFAALLDSPTSSGDGWDSIFAGLTAPPSSAGDA